MTLRWPFVLRSRYDALNRLVHRHHDVGVMHGACGTDAMAFHWGRECPACKEERRQVGPWEKVEQ